MILAGERREGGRDEQHVGALFSQVTVELRKAHVVTDGQPNPAQAWHLHHRRQGLTGLHRGGFPVGVAVGQIHVEEVDLVVGGQDLAVVAHQLGTVVGEPLAGGHGIAPAQQGHLITAGHGDQKTLGPFSQGGRQLEATLVIAHEGEVLGQAH